MRKEPGWSIRRRKNKLATGPPGLEHPGGSNPGLEHPGQSGAQPPDWIVRGSGPSADDWNIKGQDEPTQQQGPMVWSICEDEVARGQVQGAQTGTSGEERRGQQQGHLDWIIRVAENPNWNIRGRSEGPLIGTSEAAQGGEGGGGKKSGRPVRENKNKSKERKGEKTMNMNRVSREGDEGAVQKETTGKARRRRKVGKVPRTQMGTSGAHQALVSIHQNTGTNGGPHRKEDKRNELEHEQPRKEERAGNRAHRSGTAGGQWTAILDWNIRRRRSRQAAGPRASGAAQEEGGGTNKKSKRPRQKRARARNGTEGKARGEGAE